MGLGEIRPATRSRNRGSGEKYGAIGYAGPGDEGTEKKVADSK